MAIQSRRPTILLTRPLPQSRRFAEKLAQVTDLPVVTAPLMAADFLRPGLPEGPFSAAIFTSETGVEAARALGAPLPARAWCVGARTAAAARVAGFDAVAAGGDAAALVAAIRSAGAPGPLLHLRGEDSRGDVAKTLTKGGIVTYEAVVYAQRPRPLTPEARELLGAGGGVIVPLFSPRSARLFAAEAGAAANLWLAALSPAVAGAVAGLHPVALEIADRPDATAMLLAVQRLIASACPS